jgi:MFS transporter, SP family, sugar:H+ symporter
LAAASTGARFGGQTVWQKRNDRQFQRLERAFLNARIMVAFVKGPDMSTVDSHSTAKPGSSMDGIAVGRVVLVAASAAMGGFLFGFDTAVINGAVDAIRVWSGADSWLLGFAVAGALLGSAAGAWFAGPLADRYGRIVVMEIAAAIFFASSIGTGLAWDILALSTFRFFGGTAIGAASVIAPAYIAEVSPAPYRGRLGSLQQLAIVTGIFVALLGDYALAKAAGGAEKPLWFGMQAWRWMFIAAAIPSAIYASLAGMIPESPRYLVIKKRFGEAAAVLHRFVGNRPPVEDKIVEIEKSVGDERARSLRDLAGPAFGLLPVVWTGILLSVFQQFVGINVIFYYSATLWHAVGFTPDDSLAITVITSITNIVVTLVAIALVDRLGRKPLLIMGSLGMALTLGVMAWVFGTAPTAMVAGHAQPQLGAAAGLIAVMAANLYVVFFGVSWGPVTWVLLGEMFNNRIRAYALAVAAAAQWVANYIVSQTFPTLAGISLGLAYGIYTLMAMLSFVFVLAKIRETRGLELEEMN